MFWTRLVATTGGLTTRTSHSTQRTSGFARDKVSLARHSAQKTEQAQEFRPNLFMKLVGSLETAPGKTREAPGVQDTQGIKP